MKKTGTLFSIMTFALLVLASFPVTESPGEQVIQKMYDRYEDSWYSHLTFRQETSFYKEDTLSRSQTWYEALSVPGKLIIKFDSLSSGTGVIFRSDTQYVFQNNRLIREIPRVHDLLVLGFDVYNQKPAETVEKLRGNGFDMDKIYETEWQGRPVYVVGAENEEDRSTQFWIDKEHLYFVRLLRWNDANDIVQETQFNKYERIAGGWVAPEVLFYNNKKLILKEVYHDIEAPETLPESIFDLEDFRQARW